MDDRFQDERWRSDIFESYLDIPNSETKFPLLPRRASTQPTPSTNASSNMLTAPPLEKSDSQWSPLSSGLVTPQDNLAGYWSYSPDRRRSGRFSVDSSGIYGQSNRWSLGTQLSNVDFTELRSQGIHCEEKGLDEKLEEWNASESVYSEDNNIFHPDDEIIVDTKESIEASIKRGSIGSKAPEWPLNEPIPKNPPIEPRFRQIAPLSLPSNSERQSLKISTCEEPESYSTRTSSYSYCSDPSFKHYDLPKVTNRRSFIESPPDIFSVDGAWPLTGSTASSSLWPHEKSLPPTPRSRGVSLSASIRRGSTIPEEYRPEIGGNQETFRVHLDRPASWNPRCEDSFDLNLEKAILGTSLARDHRMAKRAEEDPAHADHGMESIFNSLKLSESNRSSSTNGSIFRNYTWNESDRRSSSQSALSEAQRHRNVMNRIVSERNLNPTQFDATPSHARYFVIKSYNEDDVHKSLKFNIWASTEIGNRRLDRAYRESHCSGPIYLFFSVNASGQFCGMARMMSPVDYTTSSSVWTQTDKWKGRMDVRWIFVKDIPNSHLRHIRVWNNENKPVTNSRDTQELPRDAGLAMLRIFADFPPKTSVILSNLVAAEMKEEAAEQQSVDPRHLSVDSRHLSVDARQSAEDGYNRGSLQSDEYSRSDIYPRQSWQSNGELEMNRSARQSYQFDTQDFPRQQNPPSRRNTISTPGPIGSNTNRLSASATPTSGMRTHEQTYLPPQSRYQESQPSSTYRSAFIGMGDLYASNRYPTFHQNDGLRYVEESSLRYF